MKKLVVFLVVCFFLIPTIGFSEKIKIYSAWYPFFSYVPFTVAIEKGFYSKRGLDVEIVTAGGGATFDSIVMVSSNKVDFAMVGAGHLMAAVEKGAPITSVFSICEKVPTVIYYKKNRIKEPKDIKSILISPKTTKGMVSRIFLKKNGLDGKVQEIVSNEPGRAFEINLLQSDKIDAVPSQILETKVYYKEVFGDQIGYFAVSDYDVRMVYLSLAVNNETIKNRPDMIQKFVSATIEGYDYSIKNIDDSITITENKYPELKRLKLREVWQDTEKYHRESKSDLYGYTHLKNWQAMKQELMSINFIKGTVDEKTLFTNRFIKR
jgi:NitT/TauT family transport system substrate-binding protein